MSATVSPIATLVSKMSIDKVLANINIITAEDGSVRNYKQYIVCSSQYDDSLQYMLFQRLLDLVPEDQLVEVNGLTLVRAMSHGKNPQPYVGIIKL